jgi:acyl-CoA thioesterase FadM
MNGFIKTINGIVPIEWVDINGHMNVTYYMNLFDKSMLFLLDKININEQSIKKGMHTMVASRVNMSYRKELLEGDDYQIMAGITGLRGSSMAISQKLMRGSVTYATCDILSISFSVVERCTVAIENDVLIRVKKYMIDGVKNPFEGIMKESVAIW